jgi:hypothetical protein
VKELSTIGSRAVLLCMSGYHHFFFFAAASFFLAIISLNLSRASVCFAETPPLPFGGTGLPFGGTALPAAGFLA